MQLTADLILVRPMRMVPLLVALTITCSTAGGLPFYGKPRDPMLRDFWAGVAESSVNTAWFKNRCFSFAHRHKAEVAIPVLLHDFAIYPGETKGFAYSWIMHGWPRARVMAILKPYVDSRDPNMSYIASNFYADFESPE
jgi:hypothetical protein